MEKGKLIEVKGDATKPQCDGLVVIAHLCNNWSLWGAGFVRALENLWPHLKLAYKAFCNGKRPEELLGCVQILEAEPGICVANLIGQNGVGRGKQRVDYAALSVCLERLATFLSQADTPYTVHMPRMGSGLAGGDWNRVQELVESKLVAAGHTVYVYEFDAAA